jgi:hypothetical protein
VSDPARIICRANPLYVNYLASSERVMARKTPVNWRMRTGASDWLEITRSRNGKGDSVLRMEESQETVEVGSSAAMWKSHRVLLAHTKKSAGIGFELIREKANEVYRTRATTDGPIRDFILTGRHFVGRVEELAMSLFDSLYNSFASFECGTNFRTWRFRTLKNTFSVHARNWRGV